MTVLIVNSHQFIHNHAVKIFEGDFQSLFIFRNSSNALTKSYIYIMFSALHSY